MGGPAVLVSRPSERPAPERDWTEVEVEFRHEKKGATRIALLTKAVGSLETTTRPDRANYLCAFCAFLRRIRSRYINRRQIQKTTEARTPTSTRNSHMPSRFSLRSRRCPKAGLAIAEMR